MILRKISLEEIFSTLSLSDFELCEDLIMQKGNFIYFDIQVLNDFP